MDEKSAQLTDELRAQLPEAAWTWLNERILTSSEQPPQAHLRQATLAFGLAGRRCGFSYLDAGTAMVGPRSLPAWPSSSAIAWVQDCWRYGSVEEQIAIQRVLPKLPWPERWLTIAAWAIRSNATAVVQSIAHDTAYLSEQADDDIWNRLILKCLFTGVLLAPIPGFARRLNPTLARQCFDYALERRAANRPVPPETWRCLSAQHRHDEHLTLLNQLDDPRDTAALSCARGDNKLHAHGKRRKTIF